MELKYIARLKVVYGNNYRIEIGLQSFVCVKVVAGKILHLQTKRCTLLGHVLGEKIVIKMLGSYQDGMAHTHASIFTGELMQC